MAISLLAPAAAWAAEPKAVIQGDLDKTLRGEIQRAVGVEKTRPGSRVDARRRAREASEAAIAVLRSEGYYDYQVEADVGEGDAPDAIVQGDARVRARRWAPARSSGTAGRRTPPRSRRRETSLALKTGAPGRAADVVAAEGRVAAMLRNRGYADATVSPRRVVVDHQDHTVQPTFHFAAGKLVRLDGAEGGQQGPHRRGLDRTPGALEEGRRSTTPPRWPSSSSGCATPASTTR